MRARCWRRTPGQGRAITRTRDEAPDLDRGRHRSMMVGSRPIWVAASDLVGVQLVFAPLTWRQQRDHAVGRLLRFEQLARPSRGVVAVFVPMHTTGATR